MMRHSALFENSTLGGKDFLDSMTMDETGVGESSVQILLVTEKFAPEIGGACAVAEALASRLRKWVMVAAPKTGTLDWGAYDRRFEFPVHRVERFVQELPRWLPRRVRGLLQFGWNVVWTRRRAMASLVRFLQEHRVNVVCINTLSCYWVAKKLRRRRPELKVVFYLHGEEVSGGPVRRWLDDLAQAELRKADGVVVVSTFTRGLAIGCGVEAGKITVIHNGVDTARFTPGKKDTEIEERFRLAGKRVLLCLARLDERKGQDMLLEAMPEIATAVPEAVLLIVGGGADEGRLRGIAERLGLREKAVFAGTATDAEVVRYYRTADVYAMPNRTMEDGDTEGFGLVFLEAGACGKPVIGGRAGGVPDAIIEGETGLLVDGRSKEELVAACVRLLGDRGLCAKMGARGLAHARGSTWEVKAREFLGVCLRIQTVGMGFGAEEAE